MATLAIIVTAHDEGELLGRTLGNMQQAAEKLVFDFEILLNVDNGDEKTKNYAERIAHTDKIKVNYTNYGDPGLARNAAVKVCDSEYVALIDADDTVSLNWLKAAMDKVLAEKEPILVHPEVEIRFDEKRIHSVHVRQDFENIWLDTLALIVGNRWCSVTVGRRDIFLKHPYSKSGDGFGYEDYYFNCETVAADIRHLIVPHTVAFCLMKQKSITQKNHFNNDVLPYTRLFDVRELQRKTRENGLPEIDKKVIVIKVPGFAIEQMDEKWRRELEEMEIPKNAEYGHVIMGEGFCRIIKELELNSVERKLGFVGNLVEYQEFINRHKKAIPVSVDQANNLPRRRNVINLCGLLDTMGLDMWDVFLARLIIQLKIQEVMVGDAQVVRDWIKAHQKLLDKNKIKVSKLY